MVAIDEILMHTGEAKPRRGPRPRGAGDHGSITISNADWSTPPTGTQPLVNNLYQGMTLDAVTGLYYERNRDYSPSLGRWLTRDPIGYRGGINLYGYAESSPVGNVDAVGLVTFPNNSEKGGGTFSVHLSPTGNGGSLWDTAVDVEFMPSKQHGCKFNQIKLIQFVRARYRVSGSAHGWKLENGVPSGLLELFDSARYYQGQALFYANQTAMLPDVLPWAESWDQPGRNRSSVSEEEWKVYAVCFGSNGAVHSFGYVSYGIDDYDRATDSPTDAISYWVAGGGASIGAPGKTPAMNVTGIAPLPGGIAP